MGKWITTSEFVKFSAKNGVARVQLHIPAARNALSQKMLVEYRAALLES